MKKISFVWNKNKHEKKLEEIDRLKLQLFDSSEKAKTDISLWLKQCGLDLKDFVTILKNLDLYENLESIEEINCSSFFINTRNHTFRMLLKSENHSSTITLEDKYSSRTYIVRRNNRNTPVLILDKKILNPTSCCFQKRD